MTESWAQRVIRVFTPFSPVSLLLLILLLPLNVGYLLPLLLINSVVCYKAYRERFKHTYKLVSCWSFPLLLEAGALLMGTKQMFLFSVGILLILIGSVGIYETWSALRKLLSGFSRNWFILCFPAAFILVVGVEPARFWSFFSGFVLVAYGFLGLRAHRQVFEEQGSYVRGMDFLGEKEKKEGEEEKEKKGKELIHSEFSLTLGGISLPNDLETHHFLIAGRTGSGKTLAISELLRGIRQRGDRVIIADPGGGYASRFFCEGDVILNPFDERTVKWSPFQEIRSNYDFGRIARSVIPDAVGDAKDWHHQAQNLFAQVMRRLYERGEGNIPELLRLLTAASVSELKPVLAGSVGEQLTHSGNEKLLSNTRGILASYLTPWEHLGVADAVFSIRDWVQDSDDNDEEKKSQPPSTSKSNWLFLTYRDDQLAELRFLISTWMDLAIVEGLSLDERTNRRLWYVMDELDSLGKINTLKDGLTKLRKYGGCCIAGLQTIAQLRHTYGHHEAQTLLSCMATKVILTAGDTETAEYFSRELGQREVLRREKTFGEDLSKTIAERHHVEWAVLPSEISSLKVREGFLRITGTSEIAKIKVPLVNMEQVTPAFLPYAFHQ